MVERTILHILDDDANRRKLIARLAFAAGHHAEVYGTTEELLSRGRQGGAVLAYDKAPGVSVVHLIASMKNANKWRPVIAFHDTPDIGAVVLTIKAGAFDYLTTPDKVALLNDTIERVVVESETQRTGRARAADANKRIADLSTREREVLERLAAGCSNKVIARDLGLSPRTVEIHRMKMMGKLGARHASDAVRLWIEAKAPDAA